MLGDLLDKVDNKAQNIGKGKWQDHRNVRLVVWQV